ncbi:MAG: helix-turn-helix domain-containing protein [Actinomycetota bacterium]|nr:helix-turn-helix domain-containing protein [Actinomycetota bacterium]
MEVNEKLLYTTIGERLRRRRVETNTTQAQLADEVGVLRTSVTNIEAGRQKLPLHLLYKLCAALDVEVSYVLPTVEQVGETPTATVEVDGVSEQLTPRLVEFLRSLKED